MKYWLVTLLLFTGLICVNAGVKAQQAKAYETVRYKAKAGNLIFLLDYADGYIGASRIRLKQNGQKTQIFLPESGTTESNGDFKFVPQRSADKTEITLTRLNDEETAPPVIRGTYRAKDHPVGLMFKRSKN